MRIGYTQACDLTGYPVTHAHAIQRVANQMNHVIIFRAVGSHCTLLLEEGYATKGFRIDTKSCDWGPMRGFVCVDPRLSKGGLGKVAFNTAATREAVTGAVREDAIGGLGDGEEEENPANLPNSWKAGALPLVISRARYAELAASGLHGRAELGHVVGISTDASGNVKFPWRLIPMKICKRVAAYAAACAGESECEVPDDSYGIFVDKGKGFTQHVPPVLGAGGSIHVSGYEALLGLTNPGTQGYGYRACVTGDYDLFAVWPREEDQERGHPRPVLVGSQPWDQRTVSAVGNRENAHHYQHYQLGNITRRIRLIKVMLNSALQSGDSGKYTGGMMVHHSDEIGNPSPGLRKTLDESFPLLTFIPDLPPRAVENRPDFKEMAALCRRRHYFLDLREEWREDATIMP